MKACILLSSLLSTSLAFAPRAVDIRTHQNTVSPLNYKDHHHDIARELQDLNAPALPTQWFVKELLGESKKKEYGPDPAWSYFRVVPVDKRKQYGPDHAWSFFRKR